MTNGEKLKEIFQISQVDDCDLNVYAWLPIHDAIEIPVEWWNAEYKAPTTDKIFTRADLDSMAKAINYGWELRVNEVLDKIRAEIDSLERFEIRGEKTPLINGDNVLHILDKYRVDNNKKNANHVSIMKMGAKNGLGVLVCITKAESEDT